MKTQERKVIIIGSVSLVVAVLLYGGLNSTGVINYKELELGGAIVGFIVAAYILNKVYGKNIVESERLNLKVDTLSSHVNNLFDEKNITSLEGVLLNSYRFYEQFYDVNKSKQIKIDELNLIFPSKEAIKVAYSKLSESQKNNLMSSIDSTIESWEKLRDDVGAVKNINIKRVDYFPNSFCVIKNKDQVFVGLYEQDKNHHIGFTCSKSWFPKSLSSEYIFWFNDVSRYAE